MLAAAGGVVVAFASAWDQAFRLIGATANDKLKQGKRWTCST